MSRIGNDHDVGTDLGGDCEGVGVDPAVDVAEEVDVVSTGGLPTTTGLIGVSVNPGGSAVPTSVVLVEGGGPDGPVVIGRLGVPITTGASSVIRGTLDSRTVIALLKPIREISSLPTV